MTLRCDALVLDFGGVITRTLFETHDLTEHELGLPPGTLGWRGPFDLESDDLWRSMLDGGITEREYWHRRTVEVAALVGADWKCMPEFLARVRGNNPAAVIRPEAIEIIAQAKAAGRRLAILSNELDLFYGPEFRGKLPFLVDFDVIVDATYTGILKPDPRAYAFVVEALDLPPSACVFVDDQARNIEGARLARMQTVHFDVTRPAASYALARNHLGL
jgi:putative hydrolase of the HAD superfamily